MYTPEDIARIEKTPHLFEVTLMERFTSTQGEAFDSGPYYAKTIDHITVNVYGFKDQAEADAFDPEQLRSYLIGERPRTFLWEAENRHLLLEKINADPDIVSGSMRIAQDKEILYGAIHNLPGCERMHTNTKTGEILCGKPQNEFGDGCLGGCVIQGYDQEFDPEFLICPLQKFYADLRFANKP